MKFYQKISLWLKFNVYSILLCLLTLGIISVLFFIPAIEYWWLSIIIILTANSIFNKAKKIFRLYFYKVRVYYTLIRKAQKKFDQRLFMPYMDTACMRCVVFWALVETGNRKEYFKIKKRFTSEAKRRRLVPHVVTIAPPKTIDVSMKNGKLHFQEIQLKQEINDEQV